MMKQFDWNTEAAKMADYVGEEMFEAHRGAMPWRQIGISVVFGNDGYEDQPGEESDSRAKREVALVRGTLEREGVDVLGFGTCPGDGYSWAMLVRSTDLPRLN